MQPIIIEGKVVKGDGYGKKLGFPTANLKYKHSVKNKTKLALGIYGGVALLHHIKKIHKAAIVVGHLDKKKSLKIEAYILGFRGQLYGRELTFYLYKFLRPFQTFRTEKLLIAQIKKDIAGIENECYPGFPCDEREASGRAV